MGHRSWPKPNKPGLTHGLCDFCGKLRFLTHNDAKRYARSRNLTGMHQYACPGAIQADGSSWWHNGHMAPEVARGHRERGTMAESRNTWRRVGERMRELGDDAG